MLLCNAFFKTKLTALQNIMHDKCYFVRLFIKLNKPNRALKDGSPVYVDYNLPRMTICLQHTLAQLSHGIGYVFDDTKVLQHVLHRNTNNEYHFAWKLHISINKKLIEESGNSVRFKTPCGGRLRFPSSSLGV